MGYIFNKLQLDYCTYCCWVSEQSDSIMWQQQQQQLSSCDKKVSLTSRLPWENKTFFFKFSIAEVFDISHSQTTPAEPLYHFKDSLFG